MRIIATQFGILFAILAFSSELVAGRTVATASVVGLALGSAILLTLIVTDIAIDRYLARKYGVPTKGIIEHAGEQVGGGIGDSGDDSVVAPLNGNASGNNNSGATRAA